MTNTKTDFSAPVFFRAVDRYVETHIVSAKESKVRGDRIAWGDGDAYPDYLLDLYRDVATLASIVNGSVDYVAGNEVTLLSALFPDGKCNTRGELPVDIVRGMALDWFIFGGFALEVIRGRDGRPAEIYNLGIEDIRTNDNVDTFWWSETWAKGGRDRKTFCSFMPDLDWARLTDEERDRHAASILYVKNSTKQVENFQVFAIVP